MSFSYTVGGKSLTHARQRNQGQDHAKGESNRAKNSTLSLTKSPGTGQRGGKRNSTGEQPGNNRGTGASSGSRRAAGSSNTKPKAQAQQTYAIVTLSDLKKNQQSKPPTGVHSKPSKNSAAIPHHSRPGRKLGGHLNSDSKTSASISRGGEGVGNQTISQNRPIKSENSEHIYSRTGASNLTSNHPTNVNRTPNRFTKSIGVTLNNKTSPNRRSPGRGRGSRSRGPSGGGMAYNSGYTSSSLYSANPRPVGQRQRRPEDDDEDPSHQRQGEAGPSQGQGSSQQQQQGESPGSYRVIQPNASKRQQLINRSSQELKAYEDYKASKKPTTIYGEAKSTGGSKSEEEARRAQEKQHQNKKYEQILKREQQRREQREREDKEFEEKKARARQTALENEQRRKEREKNFLKDEHTRTNEQFLRRFEAAKSLSQSSTSVSQTPELRHLLEMFPQKKPAKLQEFLKITDNDVEKVIDLLMD